MYIHICSVVEIPASKMKELLVSILKSVKIVVRSCDWLAIKPLFQGGLTLFKTSVLSGKSCIVTDSSLLNLYLYNIKFMTIW